MKKILLALSLFSLTASAVKVKRIDPTNWFVGMKDPTLQLMVYGEGIRNANVSTNYPGVEITSVERMDSPNYLLVYLNLANAKAGTVPLVFAQGKQKTTVNYELKAREMPGEARMGFSNADVLYMFMPDRFASSGTKRHPLPGLNAYRVDRSQPSLRHGGDLEGIRQHLDYFTQLGVTALWFTPVLENNTPDEKDQSTYHGYATTDYYRVDPRFGSNADYRQLIDDAHAKGLKVVMDMIFNHCGITHPWVKDMPARNWFNRPDYKNHYLQTSYKLTPVLDPYASEVDLDETVDGWFVPSMPDLNQRNPHVLRYLIQNSIWWIETVGIDGIRMDTYPYADREAMAKWMARINQEYPNFNTVGETWVTEPAYTAAWQQGSKLSTIDSHLKTVMDFAFFDRINQAKNEETDGWWNGLNRVYNALCYDYLYPNPSSVMAFIENHDTDRFLANGNDTLALKQALALLLTMNRIPQLYYGTEILMNGTKEVTDGNVRRDFPGVVGAIAHPQVDMSRVNYSKKSWATQPTQMISYVSCHDDMCLTDRIRNSMPGITTAELIRLDLLAQTFVFTSQGVPFMLCGEEMLRDKKGVHNSYCSPDSINQLDWRNLERYPQVFAYYKGLIALRKAHPAFRLGDAELVRKHLEFIDAPANVVAFRLKNHAGGDTAKDIVVVLNANREAQVVDIPQGEYRIVVCDGVVNEAGLGTMKGGKATVDGQSALILMH